MFLTVACRPEDGRPISTVLPARSADLAIPEFQLVAETLPHRPIAYAGLGDSALQQGDKNKARFYYLAALKRKPDYKYVKKQLAQLDSEAQQQITIEQ